MPDNFDDTETIESSGWEITSEAMGWIGILLVLAAYCLTVFSVISGDSLLFMAMNLVGAIGIAVDAWEDKNIQPVVLNIVWGVVAVIGLVTYFS